MKSSELITDVLNDLTDCPIDRKVRTSYRSKNPTMQIKRNLASDKEVFIRILDRFSQLNNAFLKKEQFDKFATTRTHAHARAASMDISSCYKNKRNKTNQLNMTSQHFNMTIKEPLFKDDLKARYRS